MLEDRVGVICGVCGGQVWNGSTETCRASCRYASALNALGGGVHPLKHLLKSNILTVTLQGGLFLWSRHIAGSLLTSNQNTNQRWLKQGSDWHFQRETEAQVVKLELHHAADTSFHGCPQTINCKIFCAPWYVKNRCLCVGVLMWP